MSANDRQVGGDHYKTAGGTQHWDFFGPQYLLGCATKYITRARFKGKQIEDLEKARHYLDKTVEVGMGRTWPKTRAIEIARFAADKGLNPAETLALYISLNFDNMTALDEIKEVTQYLLDEALDENAMYAKMAEDARIVAPPPFDSIDGLIAYDGEALANERDFYDYIAGQTDITRPEARVWGLQRYAAGVRSLDEADDVIALIKKSRTPGTPEDGGQHHTSISRPERVTFTSDDAGSGQ